MERGYGMVKYVIRRVLLMLMVFMIIISMCFVLVKLLPDKPAEQFGILLGEVAAMKDDEWSDELRVLGNNLGRFIYLLDAYDDLEKDEKKNNYNVFKYHKDVEDFDTFAENILKAYMAGCARAFERLPILANAELLRNIIYSGVWTKFYAARRKRIDTAGKQLEEHNDRSI